MPTQTNLPAVSTNQSQIQSQAQPNSFAQAVSLANSTVEYAKVVARIGQEPNGASLPDPDPSTLIPSMEKSLGELVKEAKSLAIVRPVNGASGHKISEPANGLLLQAKDIVAGALNKIVDIAAPHGSGPIDKARQLSNTATAGTSQPPSSDSQAGQGAVIVSSQVGQQASDVQQDSENSKK